MEYDHEDQEDEQEGEIGSTGPSFDDSVFLNPARPNKSPGPAEAPPPPPPPQRKHRYRECLKNHAVGIGGHAVGIGGHAVDGCGEFIPAGEDGTLESLRCAACNCHRNFHRKETEPAAAFPFPHHQQQQLLLTHHGHFGYRAPSGYLHVASAPPPQRPQTLALLALPSSSGGGGSVPRSEELEDYYYSNNNNNNNNNSNAGMIISGSGKKRFRTKFTAEQKDKMLNFAEGLGWRIQKQDEESVQTFCDELGIKRHVLKVWMHNNKHTLGKKNQLIIN